MFYIRHMYIYIYIIIYIYIYTWGELLAGGAQARTATLHLAGSYLPYATP